MMMQMVVRKRDTTSIYAIFNRNIEKRNREEGMGVLRCYFLFNTVLTHGCPFSDVVFHSSLFRLIESPSPKHCAKVSITASLLKKDDDHPVFLLAFCFCSNPFRCLYVRPSSLSSPSLEVN
uniref:Uncharacterized protein n=1 Tax=Proboscia inermis TaxID=420281 RepID=A0A7S0GF71_9STRA